MRKVLLIESDLASGLECLRILAVAGFQVEHVTTSAEAMSALDRSRPDVVALSLLFRANQAIRLLQAIRSRSRTETLPVVAFTRVNVEKLIDDARLEGATECVILEPRRAQDLLVAVNKILPPPATSAEAPAQEAGSAVPPSARPASPALEPPPKEVPSVPKATPPPTEPEPVSKPETPRPKLSLLQTLKELARRLFGAQDQVIRQTVLLELEEKAQAFVAEGAARQSDLATNLAGALAALLRELCEKPKSISSSLVRTISQAVDSLERLLAPSAAPSAQAQPQFRILVVDDEPGVRNIVNRALASVKLTSDNAGNSLQALELSKSQQYDLFVLDIDMPGPSGFELCQKLRTTTAYRATPVIFVTALDDFQTRIRSASSGGDDFIGKPFLPKELAIKALIHLAARRRGPVAM